MTTARKVSKEEVVAKLKDDGDFDRLRLKIIRRLKENEELRNNMISVVKESTVLNRPGAQNMKPRQLSDAIFEEVGSKMLSQLSDELWGIIRSEEGMKKEIRETVESVYATLSNPGGVQYGTSTREADHKIPIQRAAVEENKGEAYCSSSSNRVNYTDNNNNIDDEEDPELPPGFA